MLASVFSVLLITAVLLTLWLVCIEAFNVVGP